MIFFPVVNEACRVFAEGIAVKAADLDIASLMGMGFPPYRFGFLRSGRVSFLSLGSCSDQFVLFGPGGALCFGLILLDPNTFTQDWRNGQRRMENSLSHVPSWLNEVPRMLLWWETWISEYAFHMIRSTSAWVSRWVITYHSSLYHQCCP